MKTKITIPAVAVLWINFFAMVVPAGADPVPLPPHASFYRDMTLRVRSKGNFKVPVPGNTDQTFSYSLQFGTPRFNLPIVDDFFLDTSMDRFFRNFWDKVFLQDGSTLTINGMEIPLTCVFISGQDNRFSQKETPLIPDFVLKIYLVANDFTCVGPINPGWPDNGGKKETWDTYLYYEVRDPTIMIPTDVKIRYRWNELFAYWVDQGDGI